MRNLDVPVFHTIDGSVYFLKRKLRGADPDTFVPLGGAWAKDAKKVFFGSFECRNINATTFRRLNQCFGVDDRAAYNGNKELKNADPTSFTVLDGGIVPYSGKLFCGSEQAGYSKDAKRVWYADFTSPKEVRGADATSFISLGNRFGRDRLSIYFEHRRIDGADLTSWRHWHWWLSLDEKNVFAFNKTIKGIDRASVILLNVEGCLMDRHKIFFGEKEITKEDYLKRLEHSEWGCRFQRENIENGKLFDRILDEWPAYE